MVPDIDFVKNTFEKYNSSIFSSQLPNPRFSLTKARTFRGKLVYKILRKRGIIRNYDFELRISISFDLPKDEWEDVVIHEMIHHYIALKGVKDTSPHGPGFRSIMNKINHIHGRHIVISAKSNIKSSETGGLIDRRIKAHYVCMARFNDGRLGVAPVAKTRIFELWNYFQTFPGVKNLKWIGTTDIWFNTLPKVLKPKLYIFSEDVIKPHLRGALILEKVGNRIRVLNRRCSPDELLP